MVLFLAVFHRPAAFFHDRMDLIFDLIGLGISVSGLLIRIVARDWKTVHRKDCLVTDGPYSVARHPMYLGSFLAGLGLCLILGSLPFIGIYSVLFIIVHARIAKREDAYMDSRWAEEHRAYAASVPACVPTPAGFWKLVTLYGSWFSSAPEAIRRERGSICGFLAGACILECASEIMQSGWTVVRQEVMAWSVITAVILISWTVIGKIKPRIAEA